jgi:hypothetical protein
LPAPQSSSVGTDHFLSTTLSRAAASPHVLMKYAWH